MQQNLQDFMELLLEYNNSGDKFMDSVTMLAPGWS